MIVKDHFENIQERKNQENYLTRLARLNLAFPLKGGDPAAGSPTATLLRLHPSYRPHLRRLLPRKRLGQRLRVQPTSMM